MLHTLKNHLATNLPPSTLKVIKLHFDLEAYKEKHSHIINQKLNENSESEG